MGPGASKSAKTRWGSCAFLRRPANRIFSLYMNSPWSAGSAVVSRLWRWPPAWQCSGGVLLKPHLLGGIGARPSIGQLFAFRIGEPEAGDESSEIHEQRHRRGGISQL